VKIKHHAQYLGGQPGLEKPFEGTLLINDYTIRLETSTALGKAASMSTLVPGTGRLLSKAGVPGLRKGINRPIGDLASWEVDGPDQFQQKVSLKRVVLLGGIGSLIFKKKVQNCFLTLTIRDNTQAVIEITDALHHQVSAELRAK
jgi:hypothetical protein